MNPIVLGFLIRECVRIVQTRAPLIVTAIIEAKHPESDGGHKLTRAEKQAIVRKVFTQIASEE